MKILIHLESRIGGLEDETDSISEEDKNVLGYLTEKVIYNYSWEEVSMGSVLGVTLWTLQELQ